MAIEYFDISTSPRHEVSTPELSRQSGTYVLILVSQDTRHITAGKLGELEIKPGYYLYVGSAFGPGGIKSRLSRHLKNEKTCRWHIDYLRKQCEVSQLILNYAGNRLEESWVDNLANDSRFTTPFNGFGASDSQKVSHLFYCRTKPQRRHLLSILKAS